MDLHYSQTAEVERLPDELFHYLMDLHYSQTGLNTSQPPLSFHYLMDLHYSQTGSRSFWLNHGFTTLWIYTILKPTVMCVGTA